MDLAPDRSQLFQTFQWLAAPAPDKHIEVRALALNAGPHRVRGIGYFTSAGRFAAACAEANVRGVSIYVGLNPRRKTFAHGDLDSLHTHHAASKADDIDLACSAMIDVDPIRTKDTAATDAERDHAITAANRIVEAMVSWGFLRPLRMSSGNGIQLWLAFPTIVLDPEARNKVPFNLKRLNDSIRPIVADLPVKVDSVQSLEHLAKTIGTVSWKGVGTPERPHRVTTALDGFERRDDAALRDYLLEPVPDARSSPGQRHLTVLTDGETIDLSRVPVTVCSPMRQFWEQGHGEDRSRDIFLVVKILAFRRVSEEDIVALVIAWDEGGGRKLVGRDDAKQYVRNAYKKVMSGADAVGGVAPPCKRLQELAICPVDHVAIRCEMHHPVLGLRSAVAALPPDDVHSGDLPYRLAPIFDGIVLMQDPELAAVATTIMERFGLDEAEIDTELEAAAERLAQWRAELLTEAVSHYEPVVETAPAELAVIRPATIAALTTPDPGDEHPVPTIDGEIVECPTNYVALRRGKSIAVSSFVIDPERRVVTEDAGTYFVGTARTDARTTVPGIYLPLAAFNSRRDLLRHLRSPDLQWTGNDIEVHGLLRVLARMPLDTRRGTTVLGVHQHEGRSIFVFPGGAITAEGFTIDAPVEYVPTGSALDQTVRFEACDDATYMLVATTVYRSLPRVNEPSVMVPVIGWTFAATVRQFCMERLRAFPILNVVGTGGSGKTSLGSEILLPLAGVVDSDPHSAVKTAFTLLKVLSSTNAVPVFIDEYKPSEMKDNALDTLHRMLKFGYKGGVEERGRPDQTVTPYHVAAPIILAGETRPTDAPLLERFLTATPAKGSVSVPEYQQAFRALTTEKLHLFAPRYIQFCLGRDLDVDLATAGRRVVEIVGDRPLPPRLITNLTVMALGVELFTQFGMSLGIADIEPLDLRAGVESVILDVTGGGSQPRNALDRLVEALPELIDKRALAAGTHFALKGSVLHVQLVPALSAYQEHLRRIGDRSRHVGEDALRRMVQENFDRGGYVIRDPRDENREYLSPGNRRRVMSIDVTKTGGLLSLEDFRTPADDVASGEAGTDVAGRWLTEPLR